MSTRPPSVPNRPFKDFVVFYAILSAIVVVVGVLTGNAALKSIGVAVVFFVIATGYSWWRLGQRSAAGRPRR